MEYHIGCMIGSAIGDAIGFNNGSWEFNYNGYEIHEECKKLYGKPSNMNLSDKLISDDTIMHEATALALLSNDNIIQSLCNEYIKCWDRMTNRAAGKTCEIGVKNLIKNGNKFVYNAKNYNKAGGGNGGSMRSMCIGLVYYGQENRYKLINVAIASCILTHHNAIAYMGAIISALFTAFAIEKIKIENWGILALGLLSKLKGYSDAENMDIKKFIDKFTNYLTSRNIYKLDSTVIFPNNYGVRERDVEYKKYSFEGWAGASGDDSVIIAYDALLYSRDNWTKLLEHACLHGGDSDSTGAIACAWFGALYGINSIPKLQRDTVENCNFLKKLANDLYYKNK